MARTRDAPKMYVASLEDYVAGELVGEWFDLTHYTDLDDLLGAIQRWLDELNLEDGRSREEFAIHDYDFCPDFGEYPDWDVVAEYLRVLGDGPDVEALNAYVTAGYDPQDFHEAYLGKFDSATELAEELLTETGELERLPKELRPYFDYEKYGHDLMIDAFFEEQGYYFWRL